MASNDKSSEDPPPEYRDATAPAYPQPMPMPMPMQQSSPSPMNPTMPSPMNPTMPSPMLQPMPSPMHQPMLQPMQQTVFSSEGVVHTTQPIISSPGHQFSQGSYPVAPYNMTQTTSFAPRLPSNPTTLVCPTCRNQIVTRVEYRISLQTHIIAAMCCMIGCCLCMWIPYYNNTFKVPEHYCPTCNTYLGCCTVFIRNRNYYYDY